MLKFLLGYSPNILGSSLAAYFAVLIHCATYNQPFQTTKPRAKARGL